MAIHQWTIVHWNDWFDMGFELDDLWIENMQINENIHLNRHHQTVIELPIKIDWHCIGCEKKKS